MVRRDATVGGMSAAALHGCAVDRRGLPAELNQRASDKIAGIVLHSDALAGRRDRHPPRDTRHHAARTAFDPRPSARGHDGGDSGGRADAAPPGARRRRSAARQPASWGAWHRALRTVIGLAIPVPSHRRRPAPGSSSSLPGFRRRGRRSTCATSSVTSSAAWTWDGTHGGSASSTTARSTGPTPAAQPRHRSSAELEALGWRIIRVSGGLLRDRPATRSWRAYAPHYANGSPRRRDRLVRDRQKVDARAHFRRTSVRRRARWATALTTSETRRATLRSG